MPTTICAFVSVANCAYQHHDLAKLPNDIKSSNPRSIYSILIRSDGERWLLARHERPCRDDRLRDYGQQAIYGRQGLMRGTLPKNG